MKIAFDRIVREARATERDAFAAVHSYLFLIGSVENPAGPEEVDAEELYADQQHTLVAPPDGTLGALTSTATRLVLPIRKRQPTFSHMITIGRTANNDLVIPDTSVSRFHAYFRESPGRGLLKETLELCDASSSNGTFVREVRLEARSPAVVGSGDQIRFGSVLTRVLDAASLWNWLQRFADSPPEP